MVSEPLHGGTQFEGACVESKINLSSWPYFVIWLLFSVLQQVTDIMDRFLAQDLHQQEF